MKIEVIQSVIAKTFPRELVTLSSLSTYHVSYTDEYIVITTKCRKYSIHFNDFLEFLGAVLSRHSFVVHDYKYEFKHAAYMLPLAEVILEELEENIYLYKQPKKMQGRQRQQEKAQCRELVSESDFWEKQHLEDTYSEPILRKSTQALSAKVDIEKNILVEVHYATNRQPCGGSDVFSADRQDDMNYGLAKVSIPKNAHRSGNVERPTSFLKLVFKENKNKHFVIDSSDVLTEPELKNSLVEKSQSKSMMLFVHGYNVSFKDAVFKSAQIKYDLKYEWPMLLFSWPSNASIRSYPSDKENALYSSKHLAHLLKVIASLKIEEVIVVAHSMGTFCLAEALSKLNEDILFQRLALAAADIDKAAFLSDYAENINKTFEQTSLYVSSTDRALLASDWMNESNRVGDTRDDVLVTNHMESIDMSNLDEGIFSLGHSYISESNRALDDLYYFLVQGMKAEMRRLQSLLNKENKEYWSLHT
jgi:esterase/lipase superfamily enzyme